MAKEKIKRFSIRIPEYILEDIDEKRKHLIWHISRNEYIIAILAGKNLKRLSKPN